jgi:NAD(P)H-quinone oxidoreductase subunit 4
MLRQVFYGKQHQELVTDLVLLDAQPREVFIAACLIIPIVGIGFYPKVATQTYDVKTVAIATQVHNVLPLVAQTKAPLYSRALVAPSLPATAAGNLLSAAE